MVSLVFSGSASDTPRVATAATILKNDMIAAEGGNEMERVENATFERREMGDAQARMKMRIRG
jgi:hypothetical protein